MNDRSFQKHRVNDLVIEQYPKRTDLVPYRFGSMKEIITIFTTMAKGGVKYVLSSPNEHGATAIEIESIIEQASRQIRHSDISLN